MRKFLITAIAVASLAVAGCGSSFASRSSTGAVIPSFTTTTQTQTQPPTQAREFSQDQCTKVNADWQNLFGPLGSSDTSLIVTDSEVLGADFLGLAGTANAHGDTSGVITLEAGAQLMAEIAEAQTGGPPPDGSRVDPLRIFLQNNCGVYGGGITN